MKNAYRVEGDITYIIIKRRNGVVVETMIDTADLEKVQQIGSIYASWSKKLRRYEVGSTMKVGKDFQSILLVRFLMGFPDGLMIDHINNNTLDNRRSCNLRVATRVLNGQNRASSNRNSKSGIRGVFWHKHTQKWTAKVVVNQKRIYLGLFKSVEAAEKAVKLARAEMMPFSNEATQKQLQGSN